MLKQKFKKGDIVLIVGKDIAKAWQDKKGKVVKTYGRMIFVDCKGTELILFSREIQKVDKWK